MCVYLVGAPVPGGQDGEPQGHARPGQVSAGCVPEQVHGVGPGEVTAAVGDDLGRHGRSIHTLQVTIATDLVKGCKYIYIDTI